MGILKIQNFVYFVSIVDKDAISRHYQPVRRALTGRGCRMFAAAEAMKSNYGGVTAVSAVTGLARSTIDRGVAEVKADAECGTGRVRRAGGGRRKLG